MTLLTVEESVAKRLVPELSDILRDSDLLQLEKSDAEHIANLFKEYGQPGLLVAEEFGGKGQPLTEFLPMLTYIGSKCPSLAIMMTMHQHTVAAFGFAGELIESSPWLLSTVASQNALVASAFAEARPNATVLESTVSCRKGDNGYYLKGDKKPCTLTHTADLALVGVNSQGNADPNERGVAIVDMNTTGIEREKFWKSDILAAADSHKVIFNDTPVSAERVLIVDHDMPELEMFIQAFEQAEQVTLTLLQLMVSASYLGMAHNIADRCFAKQAGTATQRGDIVSRLKSCSMQIQYLAGCLAQEFDPGMIFAQSLMARRVIMQQVEQAVEESIRVLGGMQYVASEELRYMILAAKCFNFHPVKGDAADLLLEMAFVSMQE